MPCIENDQMDLLLHLLFKFTVRKKDAQHCTVQYSHCRGAEEPHAAPEPRVADPYVEPYLFDVLDVFVSPVATVSITFSCPLETLPLSFLLFAVRFSLCCAFVYVLLVCVCAARLCMCCAFLYLLRVSVMCCVVL